MKQTLLTVFILFSFFKCFSFQDDGLSFNGSLPSNLVLSCDENIPSIPTLTATSNCGSTETTMCGDQIAVESEGPGIFKAEIYIGDGTGIFGAHFITANIPDRIIIEYDGNEYSSGYMGANNTDPDTIEDLLGADGAFLPVSLYQDTGNGYEYVDQGYTEQIQIDPTIIDYTGLNDTNITFNKTSSSPDYMSVTCIGPITNAVMGYEIICEEDLIEGNQTPAEAVVTYTEIVNNGNCSYNYDIIRTWIATDECNNSITHSQTITIEDITAPTFTVPSTVSISCEEDIDDLSITGDVIDEQDNCSTGLEAIYNDVFISGDCSGNYTIEREWTLTDDCGNSTQQIQTITVEDITAPTFTVPSTVSISCEEDIDDLSITGEITDEQDNCSTGLEAVYNDIFISGDCSGNYTIEREWTLTDDCGNTAQQIQTINVQDNISPDFTESLPLDITISCIQQIPQAITLTAEDNCSQVTVNFEEQVLSGDCINSYEIRRIWTAIDDCDNATIHTQSIFIEDNTAPVFETNNLETSLSIFCENLDSQNIPEVTAVDNCGEVSIIYSEEEIPGDCTNSYQLIRKWLATDDCGNTSEFIQNIELLCRQLTIYQGVSANEDGINDVFYIEGIECFPQNRVRIFNRYGTVIFDKKGYDNSEIVFRGYSEGTGYNGTSKLPAATYYYIVDYEYQTSNNDKKSLQRKGYLYLTH